MIKKSLVDHYPELIKSWHPYKNGSLTPYKIAPKSNKKVWWQCGQGHEWQASIANRTGVNKTGCPYCAGKKPTDNNNFAALFPYLVNEWVFKKNGSIGPNAFKPNSHKKIWWKCKEGHEWQTRIVYRTRQGSGCPYCSGKLAGLDNSLAVLHPALAKEWHQEKNGNLTPNDVRPGTDRKVWWLCDKGHSWAAAVCSRTRSVKATGCPYCSGRNATVENNLGVLFPGLLSEWHFTKNEPLRPDMLKSGSNRKVWWQCSRGHEWKTSPNKRTGADKTGCPYCNPQTSRLEIRILCELRHILNNVEWRAKIANMEVDIYVPRYSFAIEVDGYRWHVGKDESDKIKGKELFKHGINLFRLRDSKLNIIEATDTLCNDNDDDIDIVHSLLSNLLTHITFEEDDLRTIQAYLRVVTPQNNLEYEKLLSYLPSPPPERSLAALYKHLIPEWHYEKNMPLTPDNFTPSARAIVWWICSKGHEYKSFLYNRIKGVGCPYCAGKRISHDNSLQSKFPHLVKEWDHEKNLPLTPSDVYHGSNLRVWWKCENGHQWEVKVNHRTRRSSGCPYCSRKLINDDNSLKALFPEIARQWHPSRNADLTPNAIAPGSSKKIWWQCEKGHEWKTSPSSRTRKNKSGCPFCAGNVASESNNLLVVFPTLAAQWHYEKNFPLTPEEVTPRSSRKLWWICSNDHEWETALSNRTRVNATSCPYCANKLVTANNNFAVKFPDLLNQWDYERNASIDPSQLLPGSNIKVWWFCNLGHQWQASINSRTSKKTGCPYCAGQKTASNRSLATEYPELMSQWNYERNSGKEPEEFSPKSGKKVWWKCSKGHEWEAVVANRSNGSGCPVCAGRRIKSV